MAAKISLYGTPIFERHAFNPLSEVTTVKSRLLSLANFAVAAIMASIDAKLCTKAYFGHVFCLCNGHSIEGFNTYRKKL